MNSITPRRSRRLAGLPPVSLEEVESDIQNSKDVKEHVQCSMLHTNESFRKEETYFMLFLTAMTMIYYFFGTFN